MFRYSILSILKTKAIRRSIHSIFLLWILLSCSPSNESKEEVSEDLNPAASGFDSMNSDEKAIAWADATMHAMGGRNKWDQTRYISWNFFNRRDLIWDKYTGRVRIEAPSDTAVYLININDETGKVLLKGGEVKDADSLKLLINRAKSIWINDSYWLVMPFKLKENGVTLKYIGEGATLKGEPATILELTFNAVGVTPDNKYEVYITKSDSLIKQWAFFNNASQDTASVIWPWDNYKDYNGLLLSSDRSDMKGPHNVKVLTELPDATFEDFNWKFGQ
ncbi:MAG TPA: hypothetical protein PKL31_12530 [Fulvivirga sp.]|nr:hypothetical protein [Fulvivirga sp.]